MATSINLKLIYIILVIGKLIFHKTTLSIAWEEIIDNLAE